MLTIFLNLMYSPLEIWWSIFLDFYICLFCSHSAQGLWYWLSCLIFSILDALVIVAWGETSPSRTCHFLEKAKVSGEHAFYIQTNQLRVYTLTHQYFSCSKSTQSQLSENWTPSKQHKPTYIIQTIQSYVLYPAFPFLHYWSWLLIKSWCFPCDSAMHGIHHSLGKQK